MKIIADLEIGRVDVYDGSRLVSIFMLSELDEDEIKDFVRELTDLFSHMNVEYDVEYEGE